MGLKKMIRATRTISILLVGLFLMHTASFAADSQYGFTPRVKYERSLGVFLHGKMKRSGLSNFDVKRSSLVVFEIEKTGEIKSVRLDRKSGNKEFDDKSMAIMNAIEKFPSFPEGMEEDKIDYSFRFSPLGSKIESKEAKEEFKKYQRQEKAKMNK